MLRALRDPRTFLTVACGTFLLASFVFGSHVLALISVACGSVYALQTAWESLRERSFDVNLLMVLAAIGAIAVGHPEDAAGLLFLFSLSGVLESYAMAKTRSAIESLVKLRPAEALRVDPDGDKKVPVEELELGDFVRVLPFEQIPSDGVLSQGAGSVDQSAMTGESRPVTVEVGDKVFAGTQNLDEMLMIRVSATVHDSALTKIVALVAEAQEHKASGERISQWFGQRYTIFVLVASAASMGIRLAIGQSAPDALYASLILLVALSPCALVISTPATTLSALAWAARNGALVRGGAFVEALGKVNVALLDKTGTLTVGKPRLAEICVCQGVAAGGGSLCVDEHACWSRGDQGMSDEAKRLLRLGAAAEQYSTHPLAMAIVQAASDQGIDVPEASDSQAIAGMGVRATVDGVPVRIGQRKFFEQGSNRLPDEFRVHAEELQAKGMTVAVLEAGGTFAALGLSDQVRSDARESIDRLRAQGIDPIIMITGDTEQTAAVVAEAVGITDFRAGLLPDDKDRIVSEFESAGKPVVMVGDGINDAPSLARATVGVAMGGLGSDVALNAADVVLMHDRVGMIETLIRLGRKTTSIIRANLIFASAVIVTLAVSSIFFRLPLPLAVIGHEGSTVLVILNGLRLLKGP
ncbi:MAG TPA: cation-translocating P-type ATPase [Fimbriimonadaceae bacterium]|nr:cation-translocating P-type ATPase [Fimbriimonadaceae bacterium]